eukprot:CAMPEP_0198112164 /NCGR_PEP_ID=MMETSP1442-20131203/4063_1 /TAXON_ID= /ORGANISM="Craspedostauros australis, Strain CCMP3328" /LENGTH=251 /DNA_ID=CAMNT_0043768855 /DNA_START=171 /DNA_END=926 /DNA_ORIENTATION=-
MCESHASRRVFFVSFHAVSSRTFLWNRATERIVGDDAFAAFSVRTAMGTARALDLRAVSVCDRLGVVEDRTEWDGPYQTVLLDAELAQLHQVRQLAGQVALQVIALQTQCSQSVEVSELGWNLKEKPVVGQVQLLVEVHEQSEFGRDAETKVIVAEIQRRQGYQLAKFRVQSTANLVRRHVHCLQRCELATERLREGGEPVASQVQVDQIVERLQLGRNWATHVVVFEIQRCQSSQRPDLGRQDAGEVIVT